jgi:hypothetical protein
MYQLWRSINGNTKDPGASLGLGEDVIDAATLSIMTLSIAILGIAIKLILSLIKVNAECCHAERHIFCCNARCVHG